MGSADFFTITATAGRVPIVNDAQPAEPHVGTQPQTSLGFMVAFGFASGLPLQLTNSTLQQWLATSGLPPHAIALTSWIGLSYTLKFLWSALFDRPAPGIFQRLGRRRGWLMLVQPAMAAACVCMALSNPGNALGLTAVAAVGVAFFSASQDILIDAWRIETYPERRQGEALAGYIWGYRAALRVAESGVIYLSTVIGWHASFLLMAALMLAGTIIAWFAPDPHKDALPIAAAGTMDRIGTAVIAPLRDFLRRPAAWWVLAFILLFRLGHMAADVNAIGFYRSLHFDSRAVSAANFLPALLGALSGAVAGGWLVHRLGAGRALMLAGIVQALSLGLYLVLLAAGHSTAMLAAKVGLEGFAGAAADTVFLTYISTLCSSAYTASQYALLSSLAPVAWHTLGGLSGYAAEGLGWRNFYAATMLACLPALLILRRLPRTAPAT
jgi:PAT family beta-lactamase induction signal transducer AmpG